MTVKRPANGWKPGQSGNPNGRKPGTGEVAKIRASIAKRLPEVIDALMTRALQGDSQAARLLLERAIAPLKAIESPQALPMPDGTLTDKGHAVLSAVAAGQISPAQGAALIGAIGSLARVAEIDELADRIRKLEEARPGTK